ncbi:hypothetical protein FOL47_011257 [Perkinsus chesapeaki]|uniref:Uncharacterized protein n=1 Tax=Perkinsus chesapeaki TaxID=330153 RepID=A0A7J6MND4_PERCH|nr:hypothetical protein FOL47_011257 [Perkinsus chesapeaki]
MAKTPAKESPRPRSSARLRSREPLEMQFQDPPTGSSRARSRSAKPKKVEEPADETNAVETPRSRSRKPSKKAAKSPPAKAPTPKATPRKATVASAKSKPAKTIPKGEAEVAKAISAKKKPNKETVRKSEPAEKTASSVAPAPAARKRAKSFGMRKIEDRTDDQTDSHSRAKRSLNVTPFEAPPVSKRQKRKSAAPQKKAATIAIARGSSARAAQTGMLSRPLPMAAMALTAVGGVLTAWFYLGFKSLVKVN